VPASAGAALETPAVALAAGSGAESSSAPLSCPPPPRRAGVAPPSEVTVSFAVTDVEFGEEGGRGSRATEGGVPSDEAGSSLTSIAEACGVFSGSCRSAPSAPQLELLSAEATASATCATTFAAVTATAGGGGGCFLGILKLGICVKEKKGGESWGRNKGDRLEARNIGPANVEGKKYKSKFAA
jgi:hypothetical protein